MAKSKGIKSHIKELTMICKEENLKLSHIQTLCETIIGADESQFTSTLVASCLVSMLSNRRKFIRGNQFEHLLESIMFLANKKPESLNEIIVLETAKPSREKLKYGRTAKKNALFPTKSSSKIEITQNKDNCAENSFSSLKARSSSSPGNFQTIVKIRSVKKLGLDRLPRTSFDASKIVRKKPSTKDGAFSMTSFASDIHAKPLEKHHHHQNSSAKPGIKDQGIIKFYFSPVYSFVENIPDLSRFSLEEVEEIKSYEAALFKFLCFDKAASPTSAVISYQHFAKKTDEQPEYSVYQPLWKRLIAKGKFDYCINLIKHGLVDIKARTTHFKGQVMIRSSNAVHEVCMWNDNKRNKFGVSLRAQLELLKLLLKKGADPNEPFFCRESNSALNKIRDLDIEEYSEKLRLLKTLPSDLKPYSLKTPVSIALLSNNFEVLKTLATFGSKKEDGEIIFPRAQGLLLSFEDELEALKDRATRFYHPSSKQENSANRYEFRIAADQELIPVVYSLKKTYYQKKFSERKYAHLTLQLSNKVLFKTMFGR
eukprot:snap_masked-scaffold_6-processed-gene-5.42-mRNA-1 protein AED:1.00 eAED:1.00 QI:0/-1/0/0/-1/1/1/0/539